MSGFDLSRVTRRGVLAAGSALPLVGWGGFARAQDQDAALADAVDAYVRQAMAAWPDQPALGIAVVREGRTVMARGYGVRRQGTETPADEGTLFAVASNTKAMTAALLAMLVDEGKVAWDAPVRTYLPGFTLSDPVIGELITVRDTLSHRAGFGLGAGDLLFWPNSDRTRAEIMAAVPHVPIEHGFRAGYHYCNLMFVVAGEIIAAVEGRPWEEVLQARILDPLGMARTVPLTSMAQAELSALPHGRVGPPLRYQGPMTLLSETIPGIWNWDSAGAAGGVCTSPVEWAEWMKTQLAQGGAPSGNRLWSEARSAEMWRPNIITNSSPGPTAELPGRAIASTYAMGWSVQDYRGERLVSHGGGSPGGISATLLIPGRRTGVSIFSNAEESFLLRALRSGLTDIAMDKAGFDWIADSKRLEGEGNARSLTAAAEIDARQAAGAPPSLPLEAYAGTWRDPWYGDIVIEERITVTSGDRRRQEFGLVPPVTLSKSVDSPVTRSLWLTFSRTPALQGALEAFEGETMRTCFPDRREEDTFVTFELENGRPVRATLRAVSPDADFSYDFHDLRLVKVS